MGSAPANLVQPEQHELAYELERNHITLTKLGHLDGAIIARNIHEVCGLRYRLSGECLYCNVDLQNLQSAQNGKRVLDIITPPDPKIDIKWVRMGEIAHKVRS